MQIKETKSISEFLTEIILKLNTIDLENLIEQINNKQEILISGVNIKQINGASLLGSGILMIDKSSIGLSRVDNTTDLSKPISIATQSALDLKANKADIKIWTPVTITGAGTRTVTVTGNLQVNSIYRIGYTYDVNTSQNISYITYQHKNNVNTIIGGTYYHSGVAGLLPNILALRNNGSTGFSIFVKQGTVTNDGKIFSVDVESNLT